MAGAKAPAVFFGARPTAASPGGATRRPNTTCVVLGLRSQGIVVQFRDPVYVSQPGPVEIPSTTHATISDQSPTQREEDHQPS